MALKKMILTFPPGAVGQPVAYHLVKDYDIKINILRGKISPEEEGTLIVELEADEDVLNRGLKYLAELGITATPLEKEIRWNEEKCVHCTACVPICPMESFKLDRESMKVHFDVSRCMVCEFCLEVCPFSAISIGV